MKLIRTSINDLVVLKPNIFNDRRGYFMEIFNQKKIIELLGDITFVQDNQSKSTRGVLRGLHFQFPPYSQSKLVRCLSGEILDVVVDLRKNSKTFGKYHSINLSESNKLQLFIPQGFAHGFVVLSETATVLYKVNNYYNSEYESGILWSDPDLNIDWKVKNITVSEKDSLLPCLSKIVNPF